MMQCHPKENAAGANRCAGFAPEHTVEINVVARVGRCIVLTRRARKRRPSKANIKRANVANASCAAGTLDVRAGKRILEKV
jgi:hypothetical protein